MPKDVIDAVGAVDISTAAERLGISVQTLEGVLDRGLLKGFKDADGRWKVLLEGNHQQGASAGPHVSMARESAGTGPSPTLSRILDDTRSPLERVLAEQVDFLRVQLSDRDRAIIEKDAVIADLSRALRALPAPASTGPAADGLVTRLESAINAVAQQVGHQSRGRELRWAMAGIVAALAVAAIVLLAIGGLPPLGRTPTG